MQTHIKRGDVAIIVLVLCVALLIWLFPLLRSSGEQATLSVWSSDGTKGSYPLDTGRTLTLTGNGHTLLVVIKDGTAFVSESDCPDGICRMGRISRDGDMLVCAPAGIALTVQAQGGDADAILG